MLGIERLLTSAFGGCHNDGIASPCFNLVGTTTALLAGAGIAAAGSVGSSLIGSEAAGDASNAQLQATLASLQQQRELTQKGFDIFRQQSAQAMNFVREQNRLARRDLQPLRTMALADLRRAEGYAKPNSAQSEAERKAFSRTLNNALSAQGLLASGTQIAGLSDFELGLARERRNIALGLAGQGANTLRSLADLRAGQGSQLAGIASNLGQTGGALYANLGQNIGNTLQTSGNNLASLALAQGQNAAQGLVGVGNAAQGALSGFLQMNQQQQQQDFLRSLLGGGGGGGPSLSFLPGSQFSLGAYPSFN